jgi:hypothetical protein
LKKISNPQKPEPGYLLMKELLIINERTAELTDRRFSRAGS